MITKQVAAALKCLGGKLEIATADPDPNALSDLTKEYNCKNCKDVNICHTVYMAVNLK